MRSLADYLLVEMMKDDALVVAAVNTEDEKISDDRWTSAAHAMQVT